MRHRTLLLALLLPLVACGGRRVAVPPALDLATRAPIALVRFTIENGEGDLCDVATQQLAEHALTAQPGIELLELGAVAERIDAAGARRLGEEHRVRGVFVGHITVSDVRPRVSVGRGLRATAEATVTMTVRLLSTETGGTVWTASATTREAIAALRILDGGVVFSADNPDEAYGALVRGLMERVTRDFRWTWRRG